MLGIRCSDDPQEQQFPRTGERQAASMTLAWILQVGRAGSRPG
ncbi:MAG: hypothetical protein U5J63_03955 [Fodinibius sp.]|nr:hypothetical protein [Fodinibius sp.]